MCEVSVDSGAHFLSLLPLVQSQQKKEPGGGRERVGAFMLMLISKRKIIRQKLELEERRTLF